MKLTKIVATIGPASDSSHIIEALISAGVNVFRFNLKHSDLSWHKERITRVRTVSKKIGANIATLIDLQGPEIRINIPAGELILNKNDSVILAKTLESNEKGFMVSHPHILKYIEEGTFLYAEDGRFEFSVVKKEGNKLILQCHSEGILKTRKSLNIPGAAFPLPVLSDKDKEAVLMAKDFGVDFIALSFVRQKSDVLELKNFMKQNRVVSKIVSKIEAQMAVANLEEIVEVSDVVMVARGDLGIELPIEEVPYYQKMIIKQCIEREIPVITATQMLESMIENPFATRAEISDIANAVYDFTDAVMLSGETASGNYPLATVEIMSKTVKFTESKNMFDTRSVFSFVVEDQEDVICDSAYNLSLQFPSDKRQVGGFVVFSQTGRTARKLSRYHASVPIYAFVPDEEIARALTLNYGVFPITNKEIFQKGKQVTRTDIQSALTFLEKKGLINRKLHYILLHGDVWMVEGKTSTIKIIAPKK